MSDNGCAAILIASLCAGLVAFVVCLAVLGVLAGIGAVFFGACVYAFMVAP